MHKPIIILASRSFDINLDLIRRVGAQFLPPWTLQRQFEKQEKQNAIMDYTSSEDIYDSPRIAQGNVGPWITIYGEILLEFSQSRGSDILVWSIPMAYNGILKTNVSFHLH